MSCYTDPCRNKFAVCIDIKQPTGLAALLRMIDRADVFPGQNILSQAFSGFTMSTRGAQESQNSATPRLWTTEPQSIPNARHPSCPGGAGQARRRASGIDLATEVRQAMVYRAKTDRWSS
jgi:hypothetical protein